MIYDSYHLWTSMMIMLVLESVVAGQRVVMGGVVAGFSAVMTVFLVVVLGDF